MPNPASPSWPPPEPTELDTLHGNTYVPDRAVTRSLLLLAGHGSVVRPETATRLQDRAFTVRTLTDAGHAMHADDLDGFVAALDGFIQAIGSDQQDAV